MEEIPKAEDDLKTPRRLSYIRSCLSSDMSRSSEESEESEEGELTRRFRDQPGAQYADSMGSVPDIRGRFVELALCDSVMLYGLQ